MEAITIDRNPGLPAEALNATPDKAAAAGITRANFPAEMRRGTHFLSIIAFNGAITSETTSAVLAMQSMAYRDHRRPMWAGWKFHQGEGQVRSRNECAHQFLQSGCEFHDLIDADIMPRPEHQQMLRQHPEAKESIICGLYHRKEDRRSLCYNSLKDGNPQPNERGLMEIAKGGTGYMQIPRAAYLKIMEAFPERWYKCDYDLGPDGKTRADRFSFFFHDIRMDAELGFMRDQSEDWAFCEMARLAGVKIYADVRTAEWKVQDEPCILHKGLAIYPLRTELDREALADQLEQAHAEIARLNGHLSPTPDKA